MKYIVISDIHGGINELNKVLDLYKKLNCSKILLLGDLFDYGFNKYSEEIITKLNSYKSDIIAVSGNCDNNIYDLLFDIPYIRNIDLNNKKIFMTHGHLYNRNDLIKQEADLIFIGHSHISSIEKLENKIIINPGSLAKSRLGSNSFCLVTEESISIRNLDNEIIKDISI